jgi:hypothetical protein
MDRRVSRVMIAVSLSVAIHQATQASTLQVNINTTPLTGATGFLAFDFLGGSPAPNNFATILNFGTNSTLGAASSSGTVSGTLVPGPLVFNDSTFFNEWLQGVTFGSVISFQLSLSTNTIPGGSPDAFSFFLLDSNSLPFATSDPSSANSLFQIDINGQSLTPNVFTSDFASASVNPAQATVPEPSPSWLFCLVILVFVAVRTRFVQPIRR